MRVGSFLLVLLLALVGLGYFMNDSQHLRGDLRSLRQEIDRLNAVLQQTEAEKQNTLRALQDTNTQFQSCRQSVEQLNQSIAQVSSENSSLKVENQGFLNQIQQLHSQQAAGHQTQPIQSTALNWLTVLTMLAGSVIILTTRGMPKNLPHKGDNPGPGSYVYLTDLEIKELIQRRRDAEKSNR